MDWSILLPGGRAMTGCGLSVQVHPAHVTNGKVRATINDLARTDEFAHSRGNTGRRRSAVEKPVDLRAWHDR